MKKLSLLTITVLLFLLCMTGCSGAKSHEVKITIPAGSTGEFVYSQEEISPSSNSVTFSCKEDMSDTKIVLKPIDLPSDAYIPEHSLASDEPVTMDATKGEWFLVGVSMQNPTSEDIILSINVEKVTVRIE